jgi:hypothetical protein
MARLATDRNVTTPTIRKIATAFIGSPPKTRVRFEMLRRIADHQAGRAPRKRAALTHANGTAGPSRRTARAGAP